jgi:hypothetical protein
MRMRIGFLPTLIFASVAMLPAASAQDETPQRAQVPAALTAYVSNDRFDPGDFGWARGYFVGDAEAEKAAYAVIRSWLDSCSQEEATAVRSALAAMGHPDVDVERLGIASDYCAQFRVLPPAESYPTLDAFLAARREIKPVINTLWQTLALAVRIARPISDDLGGDLHHRQISDQVLRNALSWTEPQPGIGAVESRPEISAAAAPAFHAAVWAELGKVDRDNTRWLKEVVAMSGWPMVSSVGADASGRAWLLVQHADHDPVFQLQVLRLMEPMVAKKEVPARNYAYLYDRIMLKLTGKQRYATQMWCENGTYVPQPLEDPAKLEELRAAMQLEPLAQYQALFGSC